MIYLGINKITLPKGDVHYMDHIKKAKKISKSNKFLRVAAAALALVCLCMTFGCSDKEDSDDNILEYENVDVTEIVKLGEYKGLTVTLLEGETKAAAVWRVIFDSSEVLEYPAEQLDYYVSQTRARCKYYASVHKVSYEEALAAMRYTEESIVSEAKGLVAADLIGIAIRADADISLTDDEKARLFDKYAEKYASDWGYNLAYVKDSLKQEVYDLMLYDKTTEYLIKNNTFVE